MRVRFNYRHPGGLACSKKEHPRKGVRFIFGIFFATSAVPRPAVRSNYRKKVSGLYFSAFLIAKINLTPFPYIMWQWPLTLGLLAWWLLSGNGLESMGLIPVADGWPWVAIGIGVFGILAQVIYLATVSRNVDKLAAIKEQMGELSNLAPQTPREGRIGWSGSGMVHRVQWVVVHRNSTARDYRPDKRTSYGKSTADAAAANRLTRVFMSI